MAHMMLESKRASRGKRMTSLVGKAAEDDEAFWGHDVWNEEGSDADSYVEEEEEKPDEFDSDFDETESEEESGSEEEKQTTKTRRTQEKKSVNNRYKDPKLKQQRNIDQKDVEISESDEEGQAIKPSRPASTKKAKRQISNADISNASVPRTMRQSTKAKTLDSDLMRKRKLAELNDRSKYVRPEKPTFTQEQMLEEALQTEEENYRWLQFRKFEMSLADEAKKAELKQKSSSQHMIRFHSDRTSGTTITFSDVDVIPAILTPQFNVPPPAPKPNTCVITGLPAKYWDPRTNQPYANLEAFKELRKRYPQ